MVRQRCARKPIGLRAARVSRETPHELPLRQPSRIAADERGPVRAGAIRQGRLREPCRWAVVVLVAKVDRAEPRRMLQTQLEPRLNIEIADPD